MNLAKCLCAVAFAAAALVPFRPVQAQAEFVGSWVLDIESSTAPAGVAPTAGMLEITAAGDGKFKSVSEATVNGATGRSEVTFSADGKDYETTSTPAPPGAPSITQAVERVSDTVYKTSIKINGQLLATALTEISGDGKTLTQTTTGVGQFAALSSTAVFRRR